MGGETMERASVGDLEELMGKRRERISGYMRCDSEGGLFLLSFPVRREVENRRD